MARTPLLSQLQKITQEVAADRDPTRRDFLRGAGAAGALGAAGSLLPGGWLSRAQAAPPGASSARVVIVGAGLAGLTAAYRLGQAGIIAQVHEASGRIGGRCWTARGVFAEGQFSEHGGELIDTGHNQIRQLVQELGLDTQNLISAQQNGTEDLYWFDDEPYTYAQATDDIHAIWQQLHRDVSDAGYPTTYYSSTQRGRELDDTSIASWIDQYVPGGRSSKLGQLLDVAYTIEYGAETSDQSSLNMLYLLAYSGQGNLRILGPSDEKFRVEGGNDLLVDRLSAQVQGQITRGSRLVAVARNANGTYALSMRQGNRTRTLAADHVVLALPFAIMRDSVAYGAAGFGALKRTAIEQQGMATNSKLSLQFTGRHWNSLGQNGNTYSDRGYQNSWEVSRAQPGASGILVAYTGGLIGDSFGSGSVNGHAQQFLAQLEPVMPGITAKWNGRATLDYWPGEQWAKGSYSYWKVGQYQTFAGVEGERSGNCHFAGEHTSIDFQGYLNGAVETGERAAAEVLGDL